MPSEEVLTGTPENIIYYNEETGFTVLEIALDEEDELVSAVGVLPPVSPGERVKLFGRFVQHREYGQQFRAERLETMLPNDLRGVKRYLASGLIKGIGEATASRIVNHFGDETLNILRYNPLRLAEIPGIGEKKAAGIAESFMEARGTQEVMVFLTGYGISANFAMKIYKLYGANAIAKIRQNPYCLVEDVVGIGFKSADKIAQEMGIEKNAPFRLMAGLSYILDESAFGMGHCYLEKRLILESASNLLEAPIENVEAALQSLTLSRKAVVEKADEEERVYSIDLWNAENRTANLLTELMEASPKLDLDGAKVEKKLDITLGEGQHRALEMALKNPVVVVTGGPGTGKTTLIRALIGAFSDYEVALAAPTGRAAKRMSEATGIEAQTLHRLLEYGQGEMGFMRNESNPLEMDVLIVDEVSMMDILLTEALLRALPAGCRLVLVGDADQLPPVGPGNFLRDVISSGVVPVARLTEIYRQGEESLIVVNAHRINGGEMPILNRRDSDFFLVGASDGVSAAKTVVDLVQRRLPKFLGCGSEEIQVLAPMRKGEAGVTHLNLLLQKALNPAATGERPFVYRAGDKVMQIKNNYQLRWTRDLEEGLGIFNGDMGFVEEDDERERNLLVRFDDGREAEYGYENADELELAYAVSVHKSQGSEFTAVVMPVLAGPPRLYTRNLLYTAITRAKRLVVLVGREQDIYRMVDNGEVQQRNSALAERLIRALD